MTEYRRVPRVQNVEMTAELSPVPRVPGAEMTVSSHQAQYPYIYLASVRSCTSCTSGFVGLFQYTAGSAFESRFMYYVLH